ncbi:hypothetical protein [Rhizobium sp. BK376]|jgi:hypothetical protein|uniref:hypothetical protein n=1 Tax=Rhizobium sp. BK376 TaxID=2512149 RepID=UPI001042A1A7|nr:hypothetical protein [Rhizobium sp. BK376]TCR81495.1 hypothetical protein EV561_11267 [Rhizobium sp. BK376]
MTRGLFILAVQILICVAISFLALWTLLRPRSFQAFVHENFGLLPDVKSGARLAPFLIQLSSLFFLWYAYALVSAFGEEIRWLGGVIRHLVG